MRLEPVGRRAGDELIARRGAPRDETGVRIHPRVHLDAVLGRFSERHVQRVLRRPRSAEDAAHPWRAGLDVREVERVARGAHLEIDHVEVGARRLLEDRRDLREVDRSRCRVLEARHPQRAGFHGIGYGDVRCAGLSFHSGGDHRLADVFARGGVGVCLDVEDCRIGRAPCYRPVGEHLAAAVARGGAELHLMRHDHRVRLHRDRRHRLRPDPERSDGGFGFDPGGDVGSPDAARDHLTARRHVGDVRLQRRPLDGAPREGNAGGIESGGGELRGVIHRE